MVSKYLNLVAEHLKGINVDYMWKSCDWQYDEFDFYNVKIKIEKPEYAVAAKIQIYGISTIT